MAGRPPGGPKMERKCLKNPTSKIFFWVVCTHFNAFCAAIQKMKKKIAPGPLGGDFRLGPWRFSNLAIFRGRELREIRENPTSKNFFWGLYVLILTHFVPLFKK